MFVWWIRTDSTELWFVVLASDFLSFSAVRRVNWKKKKNAGANWCLAKDEQWRDTGRGIEENKGNGAKNKPEKWNVHKHLSYSGLAYWNLSDLRTRPRKETRLKGRQRESQTDLQRERRFRQKEEKRKERRRRLTSGRDRWETRAAATMIETRCTRRTDTERKSDRAEGSLENGGVIEDDMIGRKTQKDADRERGNRREGGEERRWGKTRSENKGMGEWMGRRGGGLTLISFLKSAWIILTYSGSNRLLGFFLCVV